MPDLALIYAVLIHTTLQSGMLINIKPDNKLDTARDAFDACPAERQDDLMRAAKVVAEKCVSPKTTSVRIRDDWSLDVWRGYRIYFNIRQRFQQLPGSPELDDMLISAFCSDRLDHYMVDMDDDNRCTSVLACNLSGYMAGGNGKKTRVPTGIERMERSDMASFLWSLTMAGKSAFIELDPGKNGKHCSIAAI